MVEDVKIDLPGLLRERMASGNIRYRVRVAGDKARRILLTVPPGHKDFLDHYHAARAGIALTPASAPSEAATPRSLSWLTLAFEEAMADQVEAGLLQQATLKQRANFFTRLRAEYGQKHMAMPPDQVVRIRDAMVATPGAADNMVKSIRALYAWAIERRIIDGPNPAAGVGKLLRKHRGAVAWSIEDLAQFRKRHPLGTTAHLALTLFMFTACRVGDVVRLGRANEVQRGGITWLEWQPGKSGSAPVSVPILPPLEKALRARPVIGPTYLLTGHGKPFASAASFGNKFRDWTAEAQMTDRSPHGIRKAAGELMASQGASQYHIMAVHGHTQAKTSEVYTRGIERAKLASDAMKAMAGLDW